MKRKSLFILSASLICLSLVGCTGKEIISRENLVVGKAYTIGDQTYFLNDKNQVIDYKGNILCENISYIHSKDAAIDTDGTIVGYEHMKNIKEVYGSVALDNNNKLFIYDSLTKRYVDDKVSFAFRYTLDFDGTQKEYEEYDEKYVVVYLNGNIKLLNINQNSTDINPSDFVFEENKYLDAYKKANSIFKRSNIVKLYFYKKDGYVRIATLFNDGQMINQKLEYVDEKYKVTETTKHGSDIADFVYYNETFALVKTNGKLIINGSEYFGYTGILLADNVLFGVKENNALDVFGEGNTSYNYVKLSNLDKIICANNNNIIAINKDNQIVVMNEYYDKENISLLKEKKIMDLACFENYSLEDYAYIEEGGIGHYNDYVIENVKDVFYYNSNYYFVTNENTITSTQRFANETLTSYQNVKEVVDEVVLFNDGSLACYTNNSYIINAISKLSNIDTLDCFNGIYVAKDTNGKASFFSNHQEVKNTTFGGDIYMSKMLFISGGYYSTDYISATYYYENTNGQIVKMEYDNTAKMMKGEIVELSFKAKEAYNNYVLTEDGRIVFVQKSRYEEKPFETYGIVLKD